MNRSRLVGAGIGFLVLAALAPEAPARAEDSRGVAFFESRIRPVLIAHCCECRSHSAGSFSTRDGIVPDD